jgi:hypothetical protein
LHRCDVVVAGDRIAAVPNHSGRRFVNRRKAPKAVVVVVRVLTEASPTQIHRARLLLEHEGAAGSPAERAAAAGRVYDKLDAHLAPLLGSAGIRALLARSAKLSQSRFSFLEAAVVESSTALRECLQAQEAAIATESASAVFGTLLALLTMFIGERLTTQALRRAWPTIEQMAPTTSTEDNS